MCPRRARHPLGTRRAVEVGHESHATDFAPGGRVTASPSPWWPGRRPAIRPLQTLESSLAWLTFYPAVMVVAIWGGLSAGLPATVLACLVAVFLWPVLVAKPFINGSADWLGMAVLILTGSMIPPASPRPCAAPRFAP